MLCKSTPRRRIAPELIAKVRQVKVFWHEQRLSTVMGMWVFYVKHFCPLGQTWLENMVQLTFFAPALDTQHGFAVVKQHGLLVLNPFLPLITAASWKAFPVSSFIAQGL